MNLKVNFLASSIFSSNLIGSSELTKNYDAVETHARVTVDIEYSLPEDSRISIDIVDPSSNALIDSNEYTVSGTDFGSSDFPLIAPDTPGAYQLEAEVWPLEDDTWIHDESGWNASISIDVKKPIPGFPMLSILLRATVGLLIP